MTRPPVEVAVEVEPGVVLQGGWWDSAPGVAPRGRVMLVHGLGDHGRRYGTLVRTFTEAGWGVVAVDQRGHGRSPGPRGVLDSFERLLDDVRAVREWTLERDPAAGTPVLYGHSMGGLVALRSVQRSPELWAAAVISAPWLATAAPIAWWKRVAEAPLARWLPRMTVAAGLRAEQLTGDADRRTEWRADPLTHDRVSAGLSAAVRGAQQRALAHEWPAGLPGLLVVPDADPVADARVTLDWARRQPPGRVDLEVVEGGLHEPHNDVAREAVCRRIAGWTTLHAGG